MRSFTPSILLAAAALLLPAPAAIASDPTVLGTWRTPTGSLLTVAPCADASTLCITVRQLEPTAPGTLDHNNPSPALRTRPLCNLEIGSAFHPNPTSSAAEDGRVYDPKSGHTYSGSMSLDGPNKLRLHGYLGVKLLGRTETWTRQSSIPTPCKA